MHKPSIADMLANFKCANGCKPLRTTTDTGPTATGLPTAEVVCDVCREKYHVIWGGIAGARPLVAERWSWCASAGRGGAYRSWIDCDPRSDEDRRATHELIARPESSRNAGSQG